MIRRVESASVHALTTPLLTKADGTSKTYDYTAQNVKDGNTVTQADVITRPVLIYFGYTFCPDVCPLDNARNAEAADILEERGIEVTPVFISVDPARDTPEVMRGYVDNLHPRMIGLTGTDEQIRTATQAYKAYFKIQPSGDEFYLVDHSTFTYLVLPEIGFVDFFRRESTPDEMADRVDRKSVV